MKKEIFVTMIEIVEDKMNKKHIRLHKLLVRFLTRGVFIIIFSCIIATPVFCVKLLKSMEEQNQTIITITNEIKRCEEIVGELQKQSYTSQNNIEDVEVSIESVLSSSEENIIRVNYIEKELPTGILGDFKTYMDYRKITDTSSKQWEMQQSAITDAEGFRRYNDLYMVALGTYYSPKVGMEFEIELSSGKIIKCITGDLKHNNHTDSTNRYIKHNGNIVEFIVDIDKIDHISRVMGDMSYSGKEGEIVRISEIKYQTVEKNNYES